MVALARAALVVAADEFEDPRFQRLRSPAHDVEALADVLGDGAIGGFQVRTVVNQSSAVVQQELERFFSERRPDDLLLLYFSCHGVKDSAGRLYFATTNTTFDLLRSTGVSASFVSEQMEYSRSKRIVVLLDCCYSGAFLKGFRARGDDSVAVDVLEGRGRAVITASRATEYAFEADELASENAQPSLFTGAVVEGLLSGNADVNGDGFVTVDELYDYVYDAVRGKVAGQTPGRWIDVEGDLVVARNPRPQEAAVSTESIPVTAPAPAPAPRREPPVDDGVPSDASLSTDKRLRAAGILAAAGGLGVLLAPYGVYLRLSGTTESLSDRDWYALGTFVLFGLAAFAAYHLLWPTTSRRIGVAVLAGACPIVFGYTLGAVADLVLSDNIGPGAGWVLDVGGLALLTTAGALAISRARQCATLFVPKAGGSNELHAIVMMAAALMVGAAASLGWAQIHKMSGGGPFHVAAPAQDLTIRLLVVTLAVWAAWRWFSARGMNVAVVAGGTVLVLAAILVVFFATKNVIAGQNWLYIVAFAVQAIGAAAIPIVSTVARPVRYGYTQLAAWIAASAAWLPTSLATQGDSALLCVALGGATVLALALARQDPDRRRVQVLSRA
jgi:hypothetical protein